MDKKGLYQAEYDQTPPPSYHVATTPVPSVNLYQPQQWDHDQSLYQPQQWHSGQPYSAGVERSLQPMQRLQNARTTSSNRLRKPIAIPATSKKIGSPFLRAYPPSLEGFMLPRDTFLRFIDDLNRIAVANPPLQVLGLAGNIVSFVPSATAQIVGTAINAASMLGVATMSKGRTEIFLREANRDIFQPRGLKVEVAKLDAVAKLAGMPILNSQNKIDKNATILQPLEDATQQSVMGGQDRRLRALEPWIAHLDVTPLPEIQARSNPLSQLNAAASERQRKKEEKKMLKDRSKGSEDYSKEYAKAQEDYDKDMRDIDKKEREIQSKEKPEKAERELRKLQREREKVESEYEKEMQKVNQDRRKDDKEEEGVRKILWLIVRNLDADDGPGYNPYVDEGAGARPGPYTY